MAPYKLPGLIDSDYQGQLMVPAWSRSQAKFSLQPMARLAQLIILPEVRIVKLMRRYLSPWSP